MVHALRAVALVVLCASAVLFGCSSCKRQPVMRLTYDVDLAHAYDGTPNTEEAMRATRAIVAKRVEPVVGRAAVTVGVRGQQIVVDLAEMDAAQLADVKAVIGRSGRFELVRVDDDTDFLAAVPESDLPPGEGISIAVEQAPLGTGPGGLGRQAPRRHARIALRPGESMSACRARFERWTSGLALPEGRRIGLQRLTAFDHTRDQEVDGGWRTYLLFERPDVSGAAVTDASVSSDTAGVAVLVTFDAAGAARFEAVTGANVERRLAILFDGIVYSTPVIKSKISGGRASITMGSTGDPRQALEDARRLELLLRAGALPAPLVLASEERIGADARRP